MSPIDSLKMRLQKAIAQAKTVATLIEMGSILSSPHHVKTANNLLLVLVLGSCSQNLRSLIRLS